MSARYCVSIGHEDVLASVIGTFDSGRSRVEDVAYCDDCARICGNEFTPNRPAGWVEVAFLPRDRYHVEPAEDGWKVFTDADGSYG